MKIGIIGAGPGGLYLGILIKKAAPAHDVVIVEREPAGTGPGGGEVVWDARLEQLANADHESHAQIMASMVRCDDVEVHHRGEVVRVAGHGVHTIGRDQLARVLTARAVTLGVELRHDTAIESPAALGPADVVVGADGADSAIRAAIATELGAVVDERPDLAIVLRTTAPIRALTYLFKPTAHGLLRVVAYPHGQGEATFVVECSVATWLAAGFDAAGERGAAMLQAAFAAELGGHRLVPTRAGWHHPLTARCARWHAGNVVLIGDAAHATHHSWATGARQALDDAIALADGILFADDLAAGLAAYEARRRPVVDATQAAAVLSQAWFEHADRYAAMVPTQLAYHMLTRSLRPSHASVARRDPSLAWAVELVLAGRLGIVPDPDETRPLRPGQVPFAMPGLKTPNRIAVVSGQASASARGVAGDDHLAELGAAAKTGAGLVLTSPIHLGAGTGPQISTDDEVVAWGRIVDFIHDRTAARCGAVIATCTDPALLVDAARRAAYAGFDLLILDVSGPEARAAVVAVGAGWPSDRALGIRVPAAAGDDAVVAARRALAAGHALCWVASDGDDVAAVVLCDRIRFEVGIATAVGLHRSTTVDLDALVASGRADLVVVERGLDAARRP